ncbi:IDEAL domain protein [Kurthia sp. 11kri321]|uniref:IDEAL domain-containing protein n=1 Tax=Kurthia sp. 11kri321 TaxID=1750719 RepID=UPI000745F038|nr:IDEAL domain-containing protein [Kurthia sp. 11kri321]AMA63119.1 IDEAL domain protein [Kurthia sp. 11kri321]
MRWEFESFEIEAINKNKTLAFMNIRINGIEHCLFVVKEKKGIRIDRFFSKNTELKASHYEMLFMLWWLDEVFKYKSLPVIHNSEELRYYFTGFVTAEGLEEFFEFREVPSNQTSGLSITDSKGSTKHLSGMKNLQLTTNIFEIVPKEIEELVKEIELQTAINIALDNNDKETFMLLTNQEVTT